MPSWNLTVNLGDIWSNEEYGFEERRDRIVARIKASRWKSITTDSEYLDSLVGELYQATDVSEFDWVMGHLYDLADADRVWIETHR